MTSNQEDINNLNQKYKQVNERISKLTTEINPSINEFNQIKDQIVNKSYAQTNIQEFNDISHTQRDSLLTILMKDKNYITLYNIIFSVLLIYIAKYLINLNTDYASNIHFTIHNFIHIFEGYSDICYNSNFFNLLD